MDNTPSAEVSASSNGPISAQNNEPFVPAPVVVHVISAHITSGIQRPGNNPHGLLRVVAAVSQAIGSCRDKLQFPEPNIYVPWGRVSQQPITNDAKNQRDDESHNRCHDNENQSLRPALGKDDAVGV